MEGNSVLISEACLLLLVSFSPLSSDFPLHNFPTWSPHNYARIISLFLKQREAHHHSFRFYTDIKISNMGSHREKVILVKQFSFNLSDSDPEKEKIMLLCL